MGSDRRFRPFAPRNRYFNPRSPDGERRTSSADLTSGEQFQSTLPGWGATTIPITATALYTFQSTLPGWGATCIPCPASGSARYFNPRSPDGERHDGLNGNVWLHRISIHAPRMGSDYSLIPVCPCCRDFNPRSPDGERPSTSPRRPHIIWISIHAPRMGSDWLVAVITTPCYHFNPRSPDGERRQARMSQRNQIYFNPRSPDGERPVAETKPRPRDTDFNPRSPDGERRSSRIGGYRDCGISIHAPRMGSDVAIPCWMYYGTEFQSTLPGWGATRAWCDRRCAWRYFNPRSPDGERPRKWTSSPTIWAKSSIFNTDCIADRR